MGVRASRKAPNAQRWLAQVIEYKALVDLIPLIELKSKVWGLPLLETNAFRDLLDQIGDAG